MKKLLISGLVIITTASAIAQGSVNFNNNVFGTNALVYWDYGGANIPLVGTNFVAELWAGVHQSSLTPVSGSISQFRETPTTSPGTWRGKTLGLPLGGLFVPITLQVRVWDVSLYPSFETAAAAGYAASSIPFTYIQGFTDPPSPRDFFMYGLTPFGFGVPEPSTIFLGLLGAGALLLRCRKRMF